MIIKGHLMKKLYSFITLISLIYLFIFQNCSFINLSQESSASFSVNNDTLKNLDNLIEKAIADSAFPGAVYLGSKDDHIFHFQNYGYFDYQNKSTKVEKNTIYDLASITKVIATTSAIMLLFDEGKIKLDEKVSDYIPEFGVNSKEEITIKDLLTHSSGLAAWVSLWNDTDNPSEVEKNLYNLKLVYKTGEKSVYSCMGFIILGKVVEKITNKGLDEFLAERLFTPLGMKNTFFNPSKKIFARIAPTEVIDERNGLIHGKVHDENAWFIGGVSGNAGLFSTAYDLSIFCQMMLNKGIYKGTRIFKKNTVELFTKRQNVVEGSSRSLGWDTPSENSSSGHYFSESSYGHTGFTGTSIWIDHEKQLFGIFLTNRVHPTRTNRKIYKMRSKAYDYLQKSIKGQKLTKNPNLE